MPPIKTFYIFHGEDDIAIEEAVNKLRAGMGEFGDMNTSEFEGDAVIVPETKILKTKLVVRESSLRRG